MRREMLCLLVGTIALNLSAAIADAADLSLRRTVNLKGSPERLWSLMGDYCAIEKWHPAVAKCEVRAPDDGAGRGLAGGVASPNRELNHSPTAGWKAAADISGPGSELNHAVQDGAGPNGCEGMVRACRCRD